MAAVTRERHLWWRHALSVLVAPVVMALVIPASILDGRLDIPTLGSALTIGLVATGIVLIAGGLALMVWTVVLFDRDGKGTLGVGKVMGEPTQLVLRGPYRHVRNPMISGLLCILLGEAAVTESAGLLVWFAVFLVFITSLIRFWEEPHLAQRYGDDYANYRHNVPRWVPRLSARTG